MKLLLVTAILLTPLAAFAMPHMEVICESLDGTVKASVSANSYSGDSTGGNLFLSYKGTEYRDWDSTESIRPFMGQYWNDQSQTLLKITVSGEKFSDAFSASFVFRTQGDKAKLDGRLPGELEISTKELHDSQDVLLEKKPAVCFESA
jgi:hypothetical protein